ncbi:unnamed protein product [Boreogadus saida]
MLCFSQLSGLRPVHKSMTGPININQGLEPQFRRNFVCYKSRHTDWLNGFFKPRTGMKSISARRLTLRTSFSGSSLKTSPNSETPWNSTVQPVPNSPVKEQDYQRTVLLKNSPIKEQSYQRTDLLKNSPIKEQSYQRTVLLKNSPTKEQSYQRSVLLKNSPTKEQSYQRSVLLKNSPIKEQSY